MTEYTYIFYKCIPTKNYSMVDIKYNIMSSYDVVCTQMKRIVVFIIEVAKIHKKCISSKAFCT